MCNVRCYVGKKLRKMGRKGRVGSSYAQPTLPFLPIFLGFLPTYHRTLSFSLKLLQYAFEIEVTYASYQEFVNETVED